MRRRWLLGTALVVVIGLLAACGEGGEEPPAEATASGGPTATPFEPSPLPPTWTPSPEGFVPSRTPTPEQSEVGPSGSGPGGALAGGTPFPPTWTPGPPPTVTPLYSPTPTGTPFPTLPPAPTQTAQPDYCFDLQPLAGELETRAEMGVTLRWTPIERYTRYLVIVRHPGGSVIYTEMAEGSTHDVPGDLFNTAGAYGWELWPLDEAGNRICFPISGEIIVRF